MSTQTLMTVEQFARMNIADTEDFEFVEGELIPLSCGTPLHSEVRDHTAYCVRSYLPGNPIGKVLAEVDCRLSENTVRRVDLSIFLGDRIQHIDMRCIPIPFASGIAVEVLSQSEAAVEVKRKTHAYLSAGCQEVWLLYADNGDVEVQTHNSIRLFHGEQLLESPLLQGSLRSGSGTFNSGLSSNKKENGGQEA